MEGCCAGLAKYKSWEHPSLGRIVLKYHVGLSELRHLMREIEAPGYIDLALYCVSQGVSLSFRCDVGEYACGRI